MKLLNKFFIFYLFCMILFLALISWKIYLFSKIQEGYFSSYNGEKGFYNQSGISTIYNPNTVSTTPSQNNYSLNTDVVYHDSPKDILAQTEQTETTIKNISPLYNLTPSKYNPKSFVPSYEDTVYFSNLTGLNYETPIYNTVAQMSGFCSYNKNFPEKIENTCNNLDPNTCASTSCCVLLGGSKCVAGSHNGPTFPSNYTENIKNKNMYFYQGNCYGNCNGLVSTDTIYTNNMSFLKEPTISPNIINPPSNTDDLIFSVNKKFVYGPGTHEPSPPPSTAPAPAPTPAPTPTPTPAPTPTPTPAPGPAR